MQQFDDFFSSFFSSSFRRGVVASLVLFVKGGVVDLNCFFFLLFRPNYFFSFRFFVFKRGFSSLVFFSSFVLNCCSMCVVLFFNVLFFFRLLLFFSFPL